jgi:predicted N-acyltransferase
MTFKIRFLDSIGEVDEALWERVTSPFLSRDFWLALEACGAVSVKAGWAAQHVLLLEGDMPRACLPLFVKNHHRGEYVFDHSWAQAYAEHGLDYYPRLVSSVPFTPVVGERVWLADGVVLSEVLPDLLEAVRQLAVGLDASSWHGLFVDELTLSKVAQADLPISVATRSGCQFLWRNQGYASFNEFIETFTAKRRKNVKAERRKVAAQGIVCQFIEGCDLTTADWVFFYQCYERTYHVRGQQPYLSLAFFEQIGRTMSGSIVLEVAVDAAGERLAAALFFKDAQTLYGRYWGALADVDCLHFEVCYYQGIEYAIERGLRFFDPGTQGEHKLVRGFSPVLTHSLHWLADKRFMVAVSEFVARERVGLEAYFDDAMAALPFRKIGDLT